MIISPKVSHQAQGQGQNLDPDLLSLKPELCLEQGSPFYFSASHSIWYSYPDIVIGMAVNHNVSLCPTALACQKGRLRASVTLREAFLFALF